MIGGVTGSYNIGIGDEPMPSLSSGAYNIAIGRLTLGGNPSGQIAIGDLALTANTTGTFNTVVGTDAATHLTTGTQNVVLGYQALQNAIDPSNNVAIGTNALFTYSTGAAYNEIKLPSVLMLYLGSQPAMKTSRLGPLPLVSRPHPTGIQRLVFRQCNQLLTATAILRLA